MEDSLLFRRVHIGPEANVRNAIIMDGCEIGEYASLMNVILDKEVFIRSKRTLHGEDDYPLVVESSSII